MGDNYLPNILDNNYFRRLYQKVSQCEFFEEQEDKLPERKVGILEFRLRASFLNSCMSKI